LRGRISLLKLLPPLIVDVFKIESVNMTRQITQQSEKNVDAQIDPTSLDEEHAKGRNKDLGTGQMGVEGERYGNDDDEDGGGRHDGLKTMERKRDRNRLRGRRVGVPVRDEVLKYGMA
jgi:hypothetical protein